MTCKKLAAALLFRACSLPALAQETLVVYWTKGFYPRRTRPRRDDRQVPEEDRSRSSCRATRRRNRCRRRWRRSTRHAADVAYGDVFDFQSPASGAAEGASRTSRTSSCR